VQLGIAKLVQRNLKGFFLSFDRRFDLNVARCFVFLEGFNVVAFSVQDFLDLIR
jgi:hypothetical protein